MKFKELKQIYAFWSETVDTKTFDDKLLDAKIKVDEICYE